MATSGAVLCISLCFIGYIPSNMFLSYNLSYWYNDVETVQSSLPNIFILVSIYSNSGCCLMGFILNIKFDHIHILH